MPITHATLTGTALHGPFRYEQIDDPGSVGAAVYWLDTTGVSPYALKRRNATNTGWDLVASGLTDPTTLQGDLIIRGASALGRLAIGATGTVLRSNGTTAVWTSSPTITGEQTATDFSATGLTGATGGARFVGATTSGAPVTGTFAVGDYVVDRSVGRFLVCTVAGTPGTWVVAAGSMTNPMTVQYDLILGGASGTPVRLPVGANGKVLTIVGGAVMWDNSPAGFSNPMADEGSIIIGDTGGTPLELGVGANGQVLTVVAGVPGWADASSASGLGGVGGALYTAATCI
jgi:hypothetical protein